MSSQQPTTTKKRKSNEVNATATPAAESTNQPHQSTLPSPPPPPHYYASPQRYAPQFAHHGGYPYASSQQYPYHASPAHGYGTLTASGYHNAPTLQQSSIHGSAYHPPQASNSFVTPENQQNTASSAFASPPSSLRRHPLTSADRGAITTSSGKTVTRACKYIHFLSILLLRFSVQVYLNLSTYGAMNIFCCKQEFWPSCFPM